jgi:hypothetical protein
MITFFETFSAKRIIVMVILIVVDEQERLRQTRYLKETHRKLGFFGREGQGEINFEFISKQLLVGVGESSVSKCGIIPHLLPFEFIAIPPKFVSIVEKPEKGNVVFSGLAGIFESLKMGGKGFFEREKEQIDYCTNNNKQ